MGYSPWGRKELDMIYRLNYNEVVRIEGWKKGTERGRKGGRRDPDLVYSLSSRIFRVSHHRKFT